MDATLRCEDSGQCEVKQRACMNGLPDRYLPMFNQQRDTTAYFCVEQPTRYRSGVMLFWGLNEQESIQLCQSMLNQVLANKRPINYRKMLLPAVFIRSKDQATDSRAY